MRTTIFSLLVAFTTLTSFSTQDKLAGATPFRDEFVFINDYTFFNTCTGENVQITGTTTIAIHGGYQQWKNPLP